MNSESVLATVVHRYVLPKNIITNLWKEHMKESRYCKFPELLASCFSKVKMTFEHETWPHILIEHEFLVF
jgi:hypothetical protein